MSKKRRKQQKRNMTLPLLAFAGGAVLILAAIFFALRGSGNPTGGSGVPDIAVSPERIDYGDVKLDTPLTFQLNVTNTGDGILRIEKDPYLEVLEGC